MGRRLKKKVLFFSLFIIILVFMDYWLDQELNPHYPLQYSEVFHPKVNADVIIIGASHATHGINPKYLESEHLKVYNFSLNGAGPTFYLNWYNKIFRQYYRRPLYVIYVVHWGMFDEEFAQRKLEQDSSYFPFHFLLKEFRAIKTLKTLALNRFAFIRERKQLTHRLFGKHPEVYLLSRYYNGFIPYERKGNLEKEKNVKPRNSRAQIRAFEELLDDFEKNKIQVIFVVVPGYLPVRSASDISESMELIHKIAEKRGISFLDYETERKTSINTNPSLFSDWIHLNEKGSDVFSKLLKSDLEFLLKQKEAKEGAPPT